MQKKSLETFLYSVGGVVAMALILIVVNGLASSARQRIDLTQEKAYTLSPGTRAILAKLDSPVKVRLYSSQDVGASPETVFLKGYARKVEDLLNEYKQAAKGKLIIEKFDPKPDSDAEDLARLDGVTGAPLPTGESYYLGLAVSQLDAKQIIPFFQPTRERLMEYDISRAIALVINPEKPVVGVMSSLPVFGMPMNPMMMQMGQRGQKPWAFITELQNDFTVKRVEMAASEIEAEIKVLVVIHPKDITPATQYAIDQFVLRGGKLVAFLDANSLVDNSNQQNPMMAQMGGGGSSLDSLLKAWGLTFEQAKVVADANYQMQVGGGAGGSSQRPTWLSLTSEAINSDDIVTSQIDNIWYFAGGTFSGTPADGLTQTVLLKSSPDSALVDGFLANLSPESAMKDFKSSGKEQTLALRLTGKFKTAFPEGEPGHDHGEGDTNHVHAPSLKESQVESTVVLVGDADLIHDNFSIQETQTPFGALRRQLNANINFAQNAVEQLAGDNNLISVRSRATLNRPFTVVRKMEAQAEARFRDEVQKLEASLQETQSRLNELQQAKAGDQRFILSPEQEAELNKFREQEARVSAQLKEVRKNLRQEVDQLQTRVKWWNTLAMPLAVTVCGLLLAFSKRKLTAAK
jgi:ABC-type uncharacterized transport system involved in gliding motility auxiliary subunit